MNLSSQSSVLTNALNKPVSSEKVESYFVLSHKEAIAASPDDMAVCGEEDPGEGLEFLVVGDGKIFK